MVENFLFLIVYLEIAFTTLYIIIKHHSKKDDPLINNQNFNIQRKNIFYILSWITFVVSTLVLLFFLYPTTVFERIIYSIAGPILGVCFLGAAIGIIIFGIRSIVEQETVFYTQYSIALHRGMNPRKVKGPAAIIFGVLYLVAGIFFLSMLLSFTHEVFCTNKTDLFCWGAQIIALPFNVVGNFLQ